MRGRIGATPSPLDLDPPARELPMLVHLSRGRLEVGQAVRKSSRAEQHNVYQGFLGRLGEKQVAGHDRFRLDPISALELIWKRLTPLCHSGDEIVLGHPGYLDEPRLDLLQDLASTAKIEIAHRIPTPLALAIAAKEDQQWFAGALVIEVDEYALTLSRVEAHAGPVKLRQVRSVPQLGLRAWRERILHALADCCILQSRRDPRALPWAEQSLFDQYESLLEACAQNRIAQITLQGRDWFQNLVLAPDQVMGFCAPLLRRLVKETHEAWRDGDLVPDAILLSAPLGRLPGLVNVMRHCVEGWHEVSHPPQPTSSRPLTSLEDFGEKLFQATSGHGCPVVVLDEEAVAHSLHAMEEKQWLVVSE